MVAADPAICATRRRYLNVGFFMIRAAIYFVLWIGLALLLDRRLGPPRRTEAADPPELAPDGQRPRPGALLPDR